MTANGKVLRSFFVIICAYGAINIVVAAYFIGIGTLIENAKMFLKTYYFLFVLIFFLVLYLKHRFLISDWVLSSVFIVYTGSIFLSAVTDTSFVTHSSVYAMASRSESFGLVLIEAQSFGLPCVAFDSAKGACEILKDGECGTLVKDRSITAMSDAINSLIENYDYRLSLGKLGRINAMEFSFDSVKEKWINFINQED